MASHRGAPVSRRSLQDGEWRKTGIQRSGATKTGSNFGGSGSQAVEIESESLYLLVTALRRQLLSVE
jgi:hypothetical protein